jgi:NAD(P)-dependent dehydrogenase (short-subunit alcohol dehydrogenase family)
MSRAFLRLVSTDKEATIINVGSWGMLMTTPTESSYSISKLALAKLSENIASAYPKVCSITYHPGMISTAMAESHPKVLHFCEDTGTLIPRGSLPL